MAENNNVKPQAIALAVVALVAGVLIGIVGNSLYGVDRFNGDDEPQVGISDEEAAAQVALSGALLNHAHITSELLRNIYDEVGDEDIYLSELSDISTKISSNIRSRFDLTRSQQTEFNEVWGSHLDNLASYAKAAADIDAEAMDEAEVGLEDFPSDIASILISEEEDLHQDVEDNLSVYVDQMLQLINAHGAGNYQEAQGVNLQLLNNVSKLANLLIN
ncbi:MAG: hypothetical protein WDZ32_01520 [Candidatus Saccharimonadales bacterium]